MTKWIVGGLIVAYVAMCAIDRLVGRRRHHVDSYETDDRP